VRFMSPTIVLTSLYRIEILLRKWKMETRGDRTEQQLLISILIDRALLLMLFSYLSRV